MKYSCLACLLSRVLLLPATLSFTLAACGGDNPATASSPLSSTSSSVQSSSTVSSDSSSSQVIFNPIVSGTRTINVDGVSRTFILQVPSSYTGMEAVPLLLDFHGIFGSGEAQRSSSGYLAISEREGFLVAYPDGIDQAWNVGPCCTFDRNVDDVKFARAIVASIRQEANIQASRIYAAGMSMGGGMTHYLACHAADIFAAFAPSAFDLLEENSPQCNPSRAVPILSSRGTNDQLVPYSGGASTPPNGLNTTIHFLGAEATLARWAELSGCGGATITDEHNCKIYRDCSEGVEVGLCSMTEAGHVPGNAEVGWAFLSQFEHPNF